MAYAVGLIVCVAVVAWGGVAVVAWGGVEVAPTLRTAWRSAAGVGVGALTIEAGFLLAYRAGWPISSASLIVNVAAALGLLVAGVVAFRETLSVQPWAGVAACVLGIVLLTSR